MVVGCGIGCDHGQMWWNDATFMQKVEHAKCDAMLCKTDVVRSEMWRGVHGTWRYVVRL